MGGFLDAITGKAKKKKIDEAIEEPKSENKPTITITVSTEAKETPRTDRKWDDYLQKWVPANEWKSPQEHEKGFQKAKGK